MSLKTRKLEQTALYSVIAALNSTRRDATVVGTRFHADQIGTRAGSLRFPTVTALTIASANASDLPTSVTLCNEVWAVAKLHVAGTDCHKVADTVAAASLAAGVTASDLTTTVALANIIKAAYEIHRASTTYHYNADSTNTIAAVNATDLASSITLLNELKSDINAHMASAVAGFSIELVDP